MTALAHSAARDGGTARVVVRLDPPELGSVVVTLALRAGQVHVNLLVADSGAAGLLDARRAEVRAALSQAGLDLEGWSVDSGVSGDRARPDERRSPGRPRAAAGAYTALAEDLPSPGRVANGLFL